MIEYKCPDCGKTALEFKVIPQNKCDKCGCIMGAEEEIEDLK